VTIDQSPEGKLQMDTTGPKRSEEDLISRRIANLSPAKVELLARRLSEKQPADGRVQKIPRRAGGGEPVPLSFAQERLWFLDRFESGRPALHMSYTHTLSSEFQIAVIDQTFAEMRRRHEVLRTTFVVLDDQPVQVIAANDVALVPIVDLDGISRAQQESLAARLALEESQRFIDLSSESSLQHKLLLSRHTALLLEKAHHIAYDARAWQVFVQERTTFQSAFSRGKPSPLPELEIQYADFSAWQRQALQGDLLDAQMSYWIKQLDNSPPLLELPTDHLRRARTVHLGQEGAVLTGRSYHSLKELSQSEGCTLYMTLLASFSALLYRYTGQTDICVGTLISNRSRSETEKLIGFFLNTLVLRADLGESPTFRELARRIRRVTLDAYANSDVPYENLLEAIGPGRDSGFAPMFRVMFGLADVFQTPIQSRDADEPVEGNGQPTATLLNLSAPPPEVNSVKEWVDIDLALSVNDLGNKVSIKLEYNSNLFDRLTVVRFLRHFVILVRGASSDPDRPIRDLPLLAEAERHTLIQELNDTAMAAGVSDYLPELFGAQVRSTPDSLAVVSPEGQFSYRAVSDCANRLARSLRETGIGPEAVIAVASERGIGFLSAMLAAFKIGGAYLPLEQSEPTTRLFQILARSLPDLILVQEEIPPNLSQAIERLPQEDRRPVVSINQCLSEGETDEAPADSAMAGRLAYVIFTSGSTGTPKGAMVECSGMVNHLRAKILDLGLTNTDIVAQTASQTFDISVWQFLAALVSGGRVCIVETEVMRDVTQLLSLAERDQVTILEIVPSLLLAMIDECESASIRPNLSALRWLLVTGEALPPDLCRKWFRLYPEIPLLNAYGPTECSDDVTHCPIYTDPPIETVNLSVGRPIVNTQLYLLDKAGLPVPSGVAGELLVGGTGVGRGYLRDAERTAESFIPNPFSSEPGARLYQTGDLARYQRDEGIQFLGRIDHQVKIRGFRIELSEIESVLLRHAAVHGAVVLAREDVPGEKKLTAYVVPIEQPGPAPTELRDYIQDQLPEYMTPSAFILIPEMPLTANGKLNRRALPAPDQSDLVTGSTLVAPDGAIETRLAEIWCQVLKLERVGAYDSFFHLGGHSLMAIQVIHRINQAFNVNLSVRTVFDEPTIAGLALVVEETLISRLEEESEQESKEKLYK
jgi:amino acid adenylation domain-containing protein